MINNISINIVDDDNDEICSSRNNNNNDNSSNRTNNSNTIPSLENAHCNINKHFQDPINKHSAARDARKRHATMTHGVNYRDLCLVNETPIQE